MPTNSQSGLNVPCWQANYKARPLLNQRVLVSKHGSWILLTEEEYASMQDGQIEQGLFDRLAQRGLIQTERNRQAIDEALELWQAPHFRGTSLHIVVTTRRCNLACRYCHASAQPVDSSCQDLEGPVADQIVDYIFQSPVPSVAIEFQGGESLLNLEAVRHTVVAARKKAAETGKKVRFSLVTNLTLLTDDILSYLKENEIGISTSLDGPQAIHDQNRPFCSGCGSYQEVMNGVRLVRERGCHTGFLTVLPPDSLPHYREIVDHHLALGIDILCLNPAQALGRGKDGGHVSDADEYLRYYRQILDYTFELLDKGVVVADRFFLLALQKITDCSDVGFVDFRNPCGAVYSQLAYDVNGDIYPCDEARSFPEFCLGNVATDSYRQIIHRKKGKEIVRASIPSHPLCRECAYETFCGLCPIMSYAEGKGLVPTPPEDFRCRLTIFLFDYVFEKMAQNPEQLSSMLRYQAVRRELQKVRTSLGR